MLPHPQDRAAASRRSRASRPGSPGASASRAGCAAQLPTIEGELVERADQAQPAGALVGRGRRALPAAAQPAQRIRWSTEGYRSIGCVTCTRRGDAGRGRRAPAAGGAWTRPSAAFISRARRRERAARASRVRAGQRLAGRRRAGRSRPAHAARRPCARAAPTSSCTTRWSRPRSWRSRGPAARLEAVGKRAGRAGAAQLRINQRLIELARAGPARACASRAAIRSCSGAAARRRWRWPRPACRSASCRASPPGIGGARLRRHPRDPSHAVASRSPSSPATMPAAARRATSTGQRSPAARGRIVLYMALAAPGGDRRTRCSPPAATPDEPVALLCDATTPRQRCVRTTLGRGGGDRRRRRARRADADRDRPGGRPRASCSRRWHQQSAPATPRRPVAAPGGRRARRMSHVRRPCLCSRDSAPFAAEHIEALNAVMARTNAEQRHWLSGFLAGYHAATAGAPLAAPRAAPPRPKIPLTILYGTEFGQCRGRRRRRQEGRGASRASPQSCSTWPRSARPRSRSQRTSW